MDVRRSSIFGLYGQGAIDDDALRDSAGCYVIHDDKKRIRYVGMSKEAIG